MGRTLNFPFPTPSDNNAAVGMTHWHIIEILWNGKGATTAGPHRAVLVPGGGPQMFGGGEGDSPRIIQGYFASPQLGAHYPLCPGIFCLGRVSSK